MVTVEPFQELPDSFQNWLRHVTFPPAVGDSSHFSTSSPVRTPVPNYSVTGVKWQLMVVLIFILLVANAVVHPVVCSLALSDSDPRRPFRSSACSSSWVTCLFIDWVVRGFHRFQIPVLYQIWFVSIFFQSVGCHALGGVFWSMEVFNFDEVQFICFVLSLVLSVSHWRGHFLAQGHEDLLFLFSSKNFSTFGCSIEVLMQLQLSNCSSCVCCEVGAQHSFAWMSSTICWKDYFLPRWTVQHHWWKSIDHKIEWLF